MLLYFFLFFFFDFKKQTRMISDVRYLLDDVLTLIKKHVLAENFKEHCEFKSNQVWFEKACNIIQTKSFKIYIEKYCNKLGTFQYIFQKLFPTNFPKYIALVSTRLQLYHLFWHTIKSGMPEQGTPAEQRNTPYTPQHWSNNRTPRNTSRTLQNTNVTPAEHPEQRSYTKRRTVVVILKKI